MAYDIEDQIKSIYQAQRSILIQQLNVDDTKTQYFSPDPTKATINVFAQDAGEFSMNWFELNENKQPTPDKI